MSDSKHDATYHAGEDGPDEATDPNPADLPTNIDGDPAGGEHDGAPTAEELAADRNLYPTATPDDVPDGSQIPHGEDVEETGGDAIDPDGEV